MITRCHHWCLRGLLKAPPRLWGISWECGAAAATHSSVLGLGVVSWVLSPGAGLGDVGPI